jgi:hypothetical protein
LEQFQSLCTEFRRKDGEPGGISAGLRKTADESGTNEIVARCNDRYSAGGLLRYFGGEIVERGDDVDFQMD